MGLLCQTCEAVLVEQRCPECQRNHGFTFQEPNRWAAEHWPDHPCFEAFKVPS